MVILPWILVSSMSIYTPKILSCMVFPPKIPGEESGHLA